MGHLHIARPIAVATVGAALMLAACGGSSGAGGGGSSGDGDPLLKLARCMRAHGVPNFPDPTPGGGLVLPNGIDPSAPAFQSAQRACDKLVPSAVGPGGPSPEAAKQAMFALTRCLRSHGVPALPDPTTTPPRTPPANGVVLGRGGVFLAITDPQAPAFKHAAAACHFRFPR